VGGYRPIGQLVGMGQRPWDPRRTSTGWPRDRSASLIADVKRRRVQACCRPTEPADAVCQVRSSHSSAFPSVSPAVVTTRVPTGWRLTI